MLTRVIRVESALAEMGTKRGRWKVSAISIDSIPCESLNMKITHDSSNAADQRCGGARSGGESSTTVWAEKRGVIKLKTKVNPRNLNSEFRAVALRIVSSGTLYKGKDVHGSFLT